MNRQEILNMVAGKEIDALIASKIFKYELHYNCRKTHVLKIDKNEKYYKSIFTYSTCMNNAMSVVELLRKNGIYLTITMDNEIYNVSAYSTECQDDMEELEGKSLPLLICKIALLCNMYDFVELEV